ncbi:MAG TPA: hypothetical protein DDX98_13700 [Bacteroidales bacterium]|nr:hypothetical protein [Bacteroidales bacterium]
MQKKLFMLLALFFCVDQMVCAQDYDTLFSLSLNELLTIKVDVTSKTAETTVEAANIISLITAKDIENNYCRDLVDVLNMVPGMNLSKDDDYTSFTSRGLYGFEGRTLIMVDGMQLSDLYFGSYVIGNDFPIHMIEQIEIIRGPGSVTYGGTAELAVINIVTKKGKSLDGITVTGRYGHLTKTYGHHDVGILAGKKKKTSEYSLLGFLGQARRSDARVSYIGENANFDHNQHSAGLSSVAFVGNVKIKDNSEIKLLFTHYSNNQVRKFSVDTATADESDTDRIFNSVEEGISSRKVRYVYTTIGAEIKHKFNISENIQLVPLVNYHFSYPYNRDEPREEVYTQRFKSMLYAILYANKTELILGGEYFGDYSVIERPDCANPEEFLRKSMNHEGKNNILISNAAIFTRLKHQINFSGSNLFLVGGLRFDINELYGSRLNPKLGITLVETKLNAKVLYSSAFRAPQVGNNAFSRYGMNPDTALYSRKPGGVSAEVTNIVEFELGWRLTKEFRVQINAYQQWVNDIIEFRYNYMNGDLYSDNGGKISTRGVEFEAKYIGKFYNGLFNLSYIDPVFFNDDNPWAYSYNAAKGGDTYITPDNIDGIPIRLELLSVPDLKIYTNHTFILSRNISVSANCIYLSEKYAYNGSGTSKLLRDQVVFGTGITLSNILPGLKLQLSIHDLFNERLNIATAWYDGGYDVLPYKGREISISAGYKF